MHKANPDIRDKNNFLPSEITEDCKIVKTLQSKSLLNDCNGCFFEEEFYSKASTYEPESEKSALTSNQLVQNLTFEDSKHSALFSWLLSHKLEGIFNNLQLNGFDDLDMLIQAMEGSMPLTDSIVKRIGIKKIGYRLRLLSKLEEQSTRACRYSICDNSNNFWCGRINKKSPVKYPFELKE